MDPVHPATGGRKQLLSNEQWTEIVHQSALPPEARPSIEVAIATYRSWRSIIDARKTPAETREELDGLRRDAEALVKRLVATMAYADAHFAFVWPLRPPQGWPPKTGPVSDEVAHQRLRSAIHELQRLATWLGLARDRVQPRKRGPKRRATPAYILVSHLNQILENFTGKTITRSAKRPGAVEFVKTVCRIADPDIGDGTIIEAMKKEIKHYRPYGEISPDAAGEIPPPIRGDKRPFTRKTQKTSQRK
jgi:hypothetical protein